MNHQENVESLLKKTMNMLTATEKHVLKHFNERRPISRNINVAISNELTFGQRIADKVASFGGSWPFIIIFICFLLAWVGLNVFIFLNHKSPFDPYPFILLNLFLSMIAAIQAPVIMMSQNRQSSQDRLMAQHDYEVNLKAELEIMSLHLKIDEVKEQQSVLLTELNQKFDEILKEIKREKNI